MSTQSLLIAILGCVLIVVMLIAGGSLFLPALQQSRLAARRTEARNNLKLIGLSIFMYHDHYSGLPPGGIYTAEGDPYNSWMTKLLPYVGQRPLYQQINQNEPWTSITNQRAHKTVIPFYLSPLLGSAGPGPSQVEGLGAAHYAANSQLLMVNESMKLRDITDGASNTILLGEVSAGFTAWGDPANLRDPALGFGDTASQFGASHSEGMIVMMLLADGSVRLVFKNTNPEVLKALATPAGWEQISEY